MHVHIQARWGSEAEPVLDKSNTPKFPQAVTTVELFCNTLKLKFCALSTSSRQKYGDHPILKYFLYVVMFGFTMVFIVYNCSFDV